MSISQSEFYGNIATKQAGALHLTSSGAAATLTDTKFEHNRAGTNGGALSVTDRAGLQMFSSSGVGNIATNGDGGFLYVSFSEKILLSDLSLKRNRASGGAGVVVFTSEVAIADSNVDENIAEKKGGAFSLNVGSVLHVISSNFTKNQAEVGGDINVQGSTLVVHPVSSSFIWPKTSPSFALPVHVGKQEWEYKEFKDGRYGCTSNIGWLDIKTNDECSKSLGILGYEASSNPVLVRTLMNDPRSSARIIVSKYCSVNVRFKNTFELENNTASCSSASPCICKKRNQKKSLGTILEKGSATKEAGSINCVVSKSSSSPCVLQTDLTDLSCFGKGIHLLNGTVIRKATATKDGGALAGFICDIYLSGTQIEEGRADGNGGAVVLNSETKLTSLSSNFVANVAALSGGAISCHGCEGLSVVSSSFKDNEAVTKRGGAMSIVDSFKDPTSENSIYDGNHAGKDAGAVSLDHGTRSLVQRQWFSKHDTFHNNEATTGNGGAFSTVGTNINFKNQTTCEKNSASKGGGGCIMWDPTAANAQGNEWTTFIPAIEDRTLLKNNKAAFQQNGQASTAMKLKVISTRATSSALGGFLFPPPQLQLLDTYGSAMSGSLVKSMMVIAVLTDSEDARLTGSTTAYFDTSGNVTFDSLIIEGSPGSGPYNIKFEATSASIGIISTTSRFLTTSTTLTVDVDECVKGTVSNGETCFQCPFGYTEVDKQCVKCPAGQYKNFEGSGTCVPCFVDSWSSTAGATSDADCQLCSSERTTGLNVGSSTNSSCHCRHSLYYQSADNKCMACPDGSDCSTHDGIKLEELGE